MDFLSSRSDSAIRKEISGIRDSYHHYWDILAEMLQNARDAINRKRATGDAGPFFVHVTIDAKKNRIEVIDNGIGISGEKLHEMLAPGGGDKDGSGAEVGEKGVGLTYVVFSGDRFEIESRVAGQAVAGGTVECAQSWLRGTKPNNRPSFVPNTDVPSSTQDIVLGEIRYPRNSYTRIAISDILPPDGDVNLFQMTAPQLRLLLRTRTAVGVTRALFQESPEAEFDVYLTLDLPSGATFEKLDASYYVPHTLVPESSRVRLKDVRNAFVTRTEAAARRRYINKRTIWEMEQVDVNGWKIDVYGVMFPDNDAFRTLSKDPLGLVSSDTGEDESGNTLFQSGIFVGTKGMPTGMRIEPKAGGRYPAYYKRCFFFAESPNLKFDLGRKSLHYHYTGRLQSAVAEIFGKFEDIAPYQGEAKLEGVEQPITKSERLSQSQTEWSEAEGLAPLGESAIPYQKIPNNQEAAVAAVFHELLGANVLQGYTTLKTGYSSRYDVHAIYVRPGKQPLKIIIEFKHDLESLVRDLREKKKYFNDIDLLVAWDADVQKLKNGDFELESTSNPDYHGVTHLLTVPVAGIDPIPVILLRTFLDRRKSGS